jgi:hypothetical protein
MITRKKKICKGCNKEKYIWSSGRCKPCSVKQKKKVKKENGIDPTNSQYLMFLKIWEESNKASEISGAALVGPEHRDFVWQFEHILPKGRYPELKFNEKNIMLITKNEHFNLTNNTHLCLADSLFDDYFKKKEELKIKYRETGVLD